MQTKNITKFEKYRTRMGFIRTETIYKCINKHQLALFVLVI